MGIKATGSATGIRKDVEEALRNQEAAIVYALGVIGEKAINYQKQLKGSKESKAYTDRSGNLRSSVGYVVVKDGEVVDVLFENAGTGTDGTEGVKTGENFARSLAGQYPKGYVLIVVAGMKYASYVANRGYDVLDGAALMAEKEAQRMGKILSE